MTMVDARVIIENLREKIKKLEDKIEAVTAKVVEWDQTHMRDPHAAPSIVKDLEQLLGLEGEP